MPSPPLGVPVIMWTMAGLAVLITVIVATLYLIARDALEDKTNWVYGVGALLLWIALAFSVEGCRALARKLPKDEQIHDQPVGDVWISVGFRTVIYATVPFLVLLGLVVGKTLWKIRQERRISKLARFFRGTLPRADE